MRFSGIGRFSSRRNYGDAASLIYACDRCRIRIELENFSAEPFLAGGNPRTPDNTAGKGAGGTEKLAGSGRPYKIQLAHDWKSS